MSHGEISPQKSLRRRGELMQPAEALIISASNLALHCIGIALVVLIRRLRGQLCLYTCGRSSRGDRGNRGVLGGLRKQRAKAEGLTEALQTHQGCSWVGQLVLMMAVCWKIRDAGYVGHQGAVQAHFAHRSADALDVDQAGVAGPGPDGSMEAEEVLLLLSCKPLLSTASVQLVLEGLLGPCRQELGGGLFEAEPRAAPVGNPAEQDPPACLTLQLHQMHAVVPAGHTKASVWAAPWLKTPGLGCIPQACLQNSGFGLQGSG